LANQIDRRDFIKANAAAGLTAALSLAAPGSPASDPTVPPVRIAVIGTGGRGRSHLRTLLQLPAVTVPALCDLNPANLAAARDILSSAGRDRPEGYSEGEHAFEKLLARDDLDAVIITTPWDWHAPMAVAAMKAGKYAAVEVPAALTVEHCWKIVDTSEQTRVPCMMLENWSFRRDNLAVLKMIRDGLLGTIVHAHCAYSHDCVGSWFFDAATGAQRWQTKHLLEFNGSLYTTHGLGPVLSWLDINCGDRLDYLTATATTSLGVNDYFARKFGPDHPNARTKYAQGDIVTTVIRTVRGKTIVVNYDVQLPRPYDNRWLVQGTRGIYDEGKNSVYIVGRSPKTHQWEPFAPYQNQFDHKWWKTMGQTAADAGHGGVDYIELALFVEAVRNKTRPPLSVYDSVTMSVVAPLSARSIAEGSAPVKVPDFTRGRWQNQKHDFALEA
jgi:predicted dehydrogenase